MTNLTPETLAELRRRAEACPMPDNDPDTLSEWYEIEDLTERNYPIPPIDAAFIAAASPDVVLGLLDRLAEVVRQKADAWDEGHADGLHNAHEYREHRKMRNPYRPETITRDATDAPVTPAAPDAINPPPDPSAAVTEPHSPERTTP